MAATFFKKPTPDELRTAFQQFDQDGSGYIQAQELQNILQKMGRHVSKSEIDGMINSLDSSGDGKISFDEFQRLFWSFLTKTVCSILFKEIKTINFRDNLFENVMAIERHKKDKWNNVYLPRLVLNLSCEWITNKKNEETYFVDRLLLVHWIEMEDKDENFHFEQRRSMDSI